MKKLIILYILIATSNLVALDITKYSYNSTLDTEKSINAEDFATIYDKNIFKTTSQLKVISSSVIEQYNIPIIQVQSLVIVNGRGQSYEITGVPFFIIGLSAKVGSVLNDSLYLIKDSSFVNNIINAYTFQNIDFKQAFVFVYDDQINYTMLTQGTNFANKIEAVNKQSNSNIGFINQGQNQTIQQVKEKIFNTNQGNFYVGFGLSDMNASDFNTYNIILGYNFNPYLSIESSIDKNPANHYFIWADTDMLNIKENYTFISLAPILKLPFLNRNTIYIKAGLGYSSAKRTMLDSSQIALEIKVQGLTYNYGIGYELALSKNNSIRLEWSKIAYFDPETKASLSGISLIEKDDDLEFNRINIAYKYTF